jgi:hypothetical protein
MKVFFFFGEGLSSRYYGRTAALRLILQTCDEDENFSCNGVPVE